MQKHRDWAGTLVPILRVPGVTAAGNEPTAPSRQSSAVCRRPDPFVRTVTGDGQRPPGTDEDYQFLGPGHAGVDHRLHSHRHVFTDSAEWMLTRLANGLYPGGFQEIERVRDMLHNNARYLRAPLVASAALVCMTVHLQEPVPD